MNLALIIAGGALALIGTLTLVLARKVRPDRGFMVRDGRSLKWGRGAFPLTVIYGTSVPSGYIRAWVLASDEFQAATGVTFFTYPEKASANVETLFGTKLFPKGCVALETDNGDAPDHGTTRPFFDTRTGEMRSATVTLPMRHATGPVTESLVMHEMGHVLGLDHDDMTDSIMWPKTNERPRTLSAHDAELLKKAYAQT